MHSGWMLFFLLAAAIASLGLYAVTSVTAVGMGSRNATVRKLGMRDLTTRVLTQTIIGLAADSSFAGGSNPRWQRRFLSIVFMFAGAAAGALLLKRSLALPLAVATVSAVCAVAVLLGKREV